MAETIHVVEQGDGWEVWREGDSMPLGTYLTVAEAEERAEAQAALDGVAVEEHDRDLEADDATPPTSTAPAAGDGP